MAVPRSLGPSRMLIGTGPWPAISFDHRMVASLTLRMTALSRMRIGIADLVLVGRVTVCRQGDGRSACSPQGFVGVVTNAPGHGMARRDANFSCASTAGPPGARPSAKKPISDQIGSLQPKPSRNGTAAPASRFNACPRVVAAAPAGSATPDRSARPGPPMPPTNSAKGHAPSVDPPNGSLVISTVWADLVRQG